MILEQPGLGSDPPNGSGREWGATEPGMLWFGLAECWSWGVMLGFWGLNNFRTPMRVSNFDFGCP